MFILFLVWHLTFMCTNRERRKEASFFPSALIHSLKRKFKINDESHGLSRSRGVYILP